jgi:uncharacterized protein
VYYNLLFKHLNMNKFTAIAVIAIILLGCNHTNTQTSAKHRIVMELSSGDTVVWKSVVGNLEHLNTEWGDGVQMELVAHGPGVGFLVTGIAAQEQAIKSLKTKGVVFSACANSLKDRKIDPSQVVSEAGIVPTGIGEVVLKQESGWSYVKAGF